MQKEMWKFVKFSYNNEKKKFNKKKRCKIFLLKVKVDIFIFSNEKN